MSEKYSNFSELKLPDPSFVVPFPLIINEVEKSLGHKKNW